MQKRIPLASQLSKPSKRRRGRTDITDTPLALRSRVPLSADTRDRIREQLTRKLRKFATHIERVTARFDDLNGPRTGLDSECRLKIVLANMESVIVEARAESPEAAFAQAGRSIERTLRKKLERLGRSAPASTRDRAAPGAALEVEPSNDAGSSIGRRVGRSGKNLEAAASRPEKLRRDVYVDTAAPSKSESDRRAGGPSTAARNTKLNRAGMTATLEDSRSTPSRKSTRRSANRVKSATNLQRRQIRATHSPGARARRAAAR